VGGVPNLLHPKSRNARWHTCSLAKAVDLPGAHLVGPGATSGRVMKQNGELMASEHTGDGTNQSRYALVDAQNKYHIGKTNSSEFGVLANLLACEGTTQPVLHITASRRVAGDNFVSCIRKGLVSYLAGSAAATENDMHPTPTTADGLTRQIGLAGVILIHEGKIRAHVMPDFKLGTVPMIDGPEVDQWLRFYEMGPGLVCSTYLLTNDPTLSTCSAETKEHPKAATTAPVSVLERHPASRVIGCGVAPENYKADQLHPAAIKDVSLGCSYDEPVDEGKGLNLRLEHTHFWSLDGSQGGHYHTDIHPDNVQYEAFLTPAQWVYRVDDAWRFRQQPDAFYDDNFPGPRGDR